MADTENHSPLCQVCGEELTKSTIVYCQVCATPHHRDCWNYLGWCSTYGCGSTVAAETEPSDEELAVINFPASDTNTTVPDVSDSSQEDSQLTHGQHSDINGRHFIPKDKEDPFGLKQIHASMPGADERYDSDGDNKGALSRIDPFMLNAPSPSGSRPEPFFRKEEPLSGFSLQVYNFMDSLPGNWLHPSFPSVDTSSGPFAVMAGFFLFPFWLLFYGFTMLCVLPMSIVMVVLMNIADLFLELIGEEHRFLTAYNLPNDKTNLPLSALEHYNGSGKGGRGLPFGLCSTTFHKRAEHKPVQQGYYRAKLSVPASIKFHIDGNVMLQQLMISDCCFVNSTTGVALVHGEKCYRLTGDGGQSWKRCILPVEGGGIRYASSAGKGKKNIFIYSNRGSIFASCDGGHSWEERTSGLTGIVDCNFVSAMNGFLLLRKKTVQSVLNRGSRWQGYDARGRQAAIIGEDTELLRRQKRRRVRDDREFYLYRTEDGGFTWTDILDKNGQSNITGKPVTISFIDEKTGWIGEVGGQIHKTVDGGMTWIRDSTYRPCSIMSIVFTNDGLGIACGSEGNLWILDKDDWLEAESPFSSLPGWHIRSARDVDGSKIAVSTSKGLVFLRWDGH